MYFAVKNVPGYGFWAAMRDDQINRRGLVRRRSLMLAAGPVVGAIAGVLTNLITAGWNWWLFGGLVIMVAGAAVLVVVSERPLPPLSEPATLATAAVKVSTLVVGGGAFDARDNPIVSDAATAASATATTVSPATIWSDVPRRNANFTGREHVLRRLHDQHAGKLTALVPHALYGLGGVGKTQLAIEYAYRYADEYDLVWWIPSEQLTLIRAAYTKLARRLGFGDDDVDLIVSDVQDALRRGEPFRRWLVVFDNAEEPEQLADFIPTSVAPYSLGQVLVTSRSRAWSATTDTIEVDVLGRNESVLLLRSRGQGMSIQEADRLANALGDLPLALDQAAAWLASTSMSVEEYLRLLDARLGDLLRENRPPSYPRSVAAAWGLAFDQLQQSEPAAAQLLELCAFFGPEPISRRLLRAGRSVTLPSPLRQFLGDDLHLSGVLGAIGRVSLARLDPSRGTIQLHRLVQAVLRDRLPAVERAARRAAVQQILAADAALSDVDDPSCWEQLEELNPHVLAAGCLDAQASEVRQVVIDQTRYLYIRGDYRGSSELCQQALTRWRAMLGQDEPHTLVISRHLANASRSLGHTDTAREMNEDTLQRLRTVLGADHEQTLATANSLAADIRVRGDFQQAYELDRETLARYRRVLGPDHVDTLRCANNLGVDLRLLGRYDQGLELDQQILHTRLRVRGADHPETIITTGSLAAGSYNVGRYTPALTYMEKALPALIRHYGPEHSQVLRQARWYAIIHRGLGHYDQARTIIAQTLDQYRNRFGDDHPDTIAAMVTLANTLRRVGDLPAARTLITDAIKRRQRLLGTQHPFTLAYTVNLAIVLRGLNDHHNAAELDERAVAGHCRLLGEEHPFTLCAQVNLATDRHLAGDYNAAYELNEHTFALSRQVRGSQHPYTLQCATNLVIDLHATGDHHQASQLEQETLAALVETLGSEHPETQAAMAGVRAECDIEPPTT
jgi:tetratricopeptide (TPR) repeat protein